MRPRFKLSSFVGLLTLILACAFATGCDDRPRTAAPTTAPTSRPANTIASCAPAATDILIGMGAANHLVAVSTFDTDAPEVRGLPRVGDYSSVDWELMGSIRPDVMIIQKEAKQLPAGFRDRAYELHIQLVNVKIDSLDDVYRAIQKLGQTAGEGKKAFDLEQKLRGQFAAVRSRVEKRPRVRTLIVTSENGEGLAGKGTFLHQILEIAGGQNLAETLSGDYPSIDSEKMVAMNPDAIIQLLFGASPQVREKSMRNWDAVPSVSAVKNKRVIIINDRWALVPGSHVGELCEKMADFLHPDAQSSTRSAQEPK